MGNIIWHKYEKYSENEPRNKSSFDRSNIPSLVKMGNGDIWTADWVFDYNDYNHKDYDGWIFRSVWGETYICDDSDDESDIKYKVIAFAYLNSVA